MKEIEGDRKKWESISCSWIGRTYIAELHFKFKAKIVFLNIILKMYVLLN